MSLIETTTSPLSGMTTALGERTSIKDISDPLDSESEDQEVEERKPAKKPKADSLLAALIDQIDDINLARYMDDDELDRIGMLVVDEYRIDETSRADWLTKAEKAMRFATQEAQPKQFPWPGASSFIYPLITQASIEFAARTYPAIVPGRAVVKGVVWGDDNGTPVTTDGEPDGPPLMKPNAAGQMEPVWLVAPGEKRKRADRIGEHMSWQLLDEMPEWEPQTDQMLHQMPVIGGAARKTFFDPVEERNRSLFVSLLNLVWNYHAPSFELAPRHTEKVLLYPNQIIDLERTCDEGDEDIGGMFLPQNYGPSGGGDGATFNGEPIYSGKNSDVDAPHLFLEQHRRLDLDGDGYPEPYIVTVHERSGKVVQIVARYNDDGIKASDDGEMIYKIDPLEHYTLYPFLPSIDGGSYPMGFGQLLRPLNEGINTTLNQMFDAGTLANSGGGFISDQLGLPSGQTLFSVGKYTRVTTKGQAIRDSVFPLPFNGPNPVLFQILGALIQAAEKIGGIGNILSGDAEIANAPPTTVLALIEQGMKLYTAIVKRVFRAEKAELNKLYALNCKHITDKTEYKVGDECRIIQPHDYKQGGGVKPVADPTMTTDMQKLGRAQVLMSTKDEPGVNRIAILRRFYEAANIDRIDDLFAQPDEQATAQAQQLQQQTQQMQIQMAQAQLGAERAKELKDQTQAFLNMALARKNANAQEESYIEAQLNFMRLKIEALNTTVKAAAVDHKYHATNVASANQQQQMMADDIAQGREHGHQRHMAANQAAQEAQQIAQQPMPSAQPAPAPSGDFPTPPTAPAGPDVTGASSPDTGTPSVPGGLAGAGPTGPGNPAPDASGGME